MKDIFYIQCPQSTPHGYSIDTNLEINDYSQDRAMDVVISTAAWAANNQAYIEADKKTITPLSYAVSLLYGPKSYNSKLLIVL